MSLSLTDVKRIAHLARLELADDAAERTLAQLNHFFALVEQMQAVDTRTSPRSRIRSSRSSPSRCACARTPRPRRSTARPTSARPRPYRTACISCRRSSNRRNAHDRAWPGGSNPEPGRARGNESANQHWIEIMVEMSLTELRAALAARSVSAVELAQASLAAIEAARDLNAFIDVDRAPTLAAARAADARLAQGDDAPLLGLPIAHKDVFVTRDWQSSAGSKMLAGYRSPFDATVVERLADAGMVCVGKTNMDEFAMGSSNENSYSVRYRIRGIAARSPAARRGGSAAAVAARLVPAATGTDTGGSIRQPASFSGVTGIKPTYGRVSRYGMIAFASSLDQGGPLARSARIARCCSTAWQGSTRATRRASNIPTRTSRAISAKAGMAAPMPRVARGPAHRPARRIFRRRARARRARRDRGRAQGNTRRSARCACACRCRRPNCRSRSTT